MLGFEFDNNSEPYSVYNGTSAITTIIFELINATITTQWAYFIYSAVLGGVAITGCSITLLFDFKITIPLIDSVIILFIFFLPITPFKQCSIPNCFIPDL